MAGWFGQQISDFFGGIFGGIGDFFGNIFGGDKKSRTLTKQVNTMSRMSYALKPVTLPRETLQHITPRTYNGNINLRNGTDSNIVVDKKPNVCNINLNIDKFINDSNMSIDDIANRIHKLLKRQLETEGTYV